MVSARALNGAAGSTLPVIFLAGPTATGKTDCALELCRRLPLELISVDAAQIFRHLNIGTAKPDAAVQAITPHRLIDIREPDDHYSAAEFVTDARREITAIHAAGRLPLLVGGTMFYFAALEQGLAPLPSRDPAVRAAIEVDAARLGWPALHARLAGIDPAGAVRIQPRDGQRIQRALEIYALTGLPPSVVQNRSHVELLPYPVVKLLVSHTDRRRLHGCIEQRFHAMLAAGLVEEVRGLLNRYAFDPTSTAMRTVGYRQVWQYLGGQCTYRQMVGCAVAATRQLAKRQLTWARRWRGAVWFDAGRALQSDSVSRYLDAKLALLRV